jgi:hypothetical protein
MAESKKDLKIRFEGRLDNLVINFGGKILYSYKREKKKEMGKTDKQKAAQSKTAITAALCSQINQIPALKYIWKKWPDKERKPYRNMLAANIRNTAPDHLTTKNIISPKTQYEFPNFCKSIDASGIDIGFGIHSTGTIETETGKTFSIIVIICLFSPMDKTKQSYKLYTLCTEIKDFKLLETYNIKIPFEPDEQKELSAYGNCIIYNTIVFDELAGFPRKWISTTPLEFVLNKPQEGGK